MLYVCVVPGCNTIVFGFGSCIEHDPRRTSGDDRGSVIADEAWAQPWLTQTQADIV